MNFWSDECTEISLVQTSLFLSQAGFKYVVSKDFIFTKSVQSVYPAKNEEIYGIAPYQKFFMSCYISYFKKENFSMWVTSGSYVGHIQIVLWVSGSNGSTGVTHFQPCSVVVYCIAENFRKVKFSESKLKTGFRK